MRVPPPLAVILSNLQVPHLLWLYRKGPLKFMRSARNTQGLHLSIQHHFAPRARIFTKMVQVLGVSGIRFCVCRMVLITGTSRNVRRSLLLLSHWLRIIVILLSSGTSITSYLQRSEVQSHVPLFSLRRSPIHRDALEIPWEVWSKDIYFHDARRIDYQMSGGDSYT
ncbi:hypothetical protein BS47DRAFT_1139690 [Hydnum rufescens UP504]|uniref:Uncharacterized protein n=1 Tax=Hydnum rufescens UP504 TaxID=1448309 RepID=A0A9P6DUL1_9AGAM|nr:hypothetical protein BS47DRAFT_1139690 [Hydnum rufescens UP504]